MLKIKFYEKIQPELYSASEWGIGILSFLIVRGKHNGSRVEIIRQDPNKHEYLPNQNSRSETTPAL